MAAEVAQGLGPRGWRHFVLREAAHGLFEGGERLVVAAEVAQGLGPRGWRHFVLREAAHGLFEGGERLVVAAEVAQDFAAYIHRSCVRHPYPVDGVERKPHPLEQFCTACMIGHGRKSLNKVFCATALALAVDQRRQGCFRASNLPHPQPFTDPINFALDAGDIRRAAYSRTARPLFKLSNGLFYGCGYRITRFKSLSLTALIGERSHAFGNSLRGISRGPFFETANNCGDKLARWIDGSQSREVVPAKKQVREPPSICPRADRHQLSEEPRAQGCFPGACGVEPAPIFLMDHGSDVVSELIDNP